MKVRTDGSLVVDVETGEVLAECSTTYAGRFQTGAGTSRDPWLTAKRIEARWNAMEDLLPLLPDLVYEGAGPDGGRRLNEILEQARWTA